MTRLAIEERRAKLLDTATRLAEQRGIGSVSAREVARASGVTIGVVHACYESKAQLMTELAQALSQEVREAVDIGSGFGREVSPGVAGLEDLLGRVLTAMWGPIESNPTRQLVTFEISLYALRGDEPERLQIAAAQYDYSHRQVRAVLELCSGATATTWRTDLDVLSRFCLNFIEGLVLRWLIDRNDNAVRTQLSNFSKIVAAQADSA